MLLPNKVSKSNDKLINLNEISEITEETTGNNNNNNNNNDNIYSGSCCSSSKNNQQNLSPSPQNRNKKSRANKVLISKNSLYMEKVLFFVDNLQKTNNFSQKFEDEFSVLNLEKNGVQQFEKKYVVPPNYMNLKSNEIIEKNKSFKKLEKKNGKVNLFEIFSNETLDNYNKDRLMVNDLDLKEKYFNNGLLNAKNKQMNNVNVNNSNNSFNNNKQQQHYLNTSLNNNNNNYNSNFNSNKKILNNSHQIYNHSGENSSFDRNYGKNKSFESS